MGLSHCASCISPLPPHEVIAPYLVLPKPLANQLEEWFNNGAADGFNIMPPILPTGLDDFVNLVVPILQKRGLFRTEYEGGTLRENLGLRRPGNCFAVKQVDERLVLA